MKYKPCCDRFCLVANCETKAEGGCYCLCGLMIYQQQLNSILDGYAKRVEDGLIYLPNAKSQPLEGTEKEEVLRKLKYVEERIRSYEHG